MQKHKKRRESVSEKLYAHELSQKNIFPRDIKNFIKMRLPKLSIPPPITFIMFLPQISKIIPQKMDVADGGGKEKQTFFFSHLPFRKSIESFARNLGWPAYYYRLPSLLSEKKTSTRSKAIWSVQRRDAKQKSARKKIKTASPALCWKMSYIISDSKFKLQRQTGRNTNWVT